MSSTTSHHQVLSQLSDLRTERDVVIATMTAGMLWPAYSRHSADLSSMAPMGSAAAFGLGVALGRPDVGVLVLDSDGSLLMNLGVMVTIGGQRPARFLHLLLENGAYDITGGQALPGTGTAALPEFAESVGYARGFRSADPAALQEAVDMTHAGEGPVMLAIPVTRDFSNEDFPAQAKSDAAVARLGRPGFENLRTAIAAIPG